MPPEFIIEKHDEEKQPHYKDQILKIIDDYEMSVRSVSPDKHLDEETHKQESSTGHKEWQEYESVRKDVCESFGVKQDDEHIFIYDKDIEIDPNAKQRAFRAFCVVIDALTDEKYYGDGRTWHIDIFNELVKRINKGKMDYSAESVFFKSHNEPSRYLFLRVLSI